MDNRLKKENLTCERAKLRIQSVSGVMEEVTH